MNDDDIRWLNWIASTLYEEANRERMTRLVTTLTADLGRARKENERGDRVVVIRKLSEVLQDARFTICCMKEASGEGLLFARKFGTEAVTKIDNAIAFADEGLGRVDGKELDRLINSLRRLQAKRRKEALRPAAKDDEGGAENYCPPTAAQRAVVIAERIEAHNSSPVWKRDGQLCLFEDAGNLFQSAAKEGGEG